ncbi:LOB domain-containing protein 27-like [Primulina tabacum]|uniref:LOB domain-containing protein 27-like n=1 Tax=Primulina tabacum TaxID=48773 RepID=UPI003F5A7D2C
MSHKKCAACTYRRKRCGADCIFAPYFPAEKAEDFENVNWLFGVQNAINILTSVTEGERSKTAETMMIEARIRKENPVHGPLAIEKKLQDEIQRLRKEMQVVQEQLDLNKSKGKDKVG